MRNPGATAVATGRGVGSAGFGAAGLSRAAMAAAAREASATANKANVRPMRHLRLCERASPAVDLAWNFFAQLRARRAASDSPREIPQRVHSETLRRGRVRAAPCLSPHVTCLAGGLAFCVAAQGHAARRRLSVRYPKRNHP